MDSIITPTERQWVLLLIGINLSLFTILKATKVCQGRERVTAYPLTSLVATCFAVRFGMTAVMDGSMAEIAATSEARLRGAHTGFDDLAQLTCAYEIWNTLSAIILPQYRTAEFLGHHIVTGTIAKLSQAHGPQFYGLFYFGIASMSTIPLVFVDIFRHGPKELAQNLPTVNKVFKVLFAVSFFVLRAITWPLVSLLFWYDTLRDLQNPEGTWRVFLFFLLLSNTFLGALQIIWAGKIWKNLKKSLAGPPAEKKKLS